ncbi:MAG TPA: alkaline phosphatase family protein [Solirubrobacteraceae bacterium]|jgi:phospholipase C|nr:alkaline phosphatase family protein [Solirubrobacteraceae bacterium]
MRSRLTTLASVLASVGALMAVATAQAAPPLPTIPPLPTTISPTASTTTPIKHVVVIFQENVSFDHYFGTYPNATNPSGEPTFHGSPETPSVNGLNEALLTSNPNSFNPFRLDRSQALICDQNHDYTAEQQAFDAGLMDQFPQFTGACADKSLPMGYYDGNTVTGLWNYAQNFAMSDNSFNTTFGPSTPGALNLVAGQTHGVQPATLPEVTENGTVFGDADPTFDDCSKGTTIAMAASNNNVGEMLNAKHITWGWFQGGFAPSATQEGKAVCGSSHKNIGGATVADYSAHHEPFQYYAATANPHHLPPSSPSMIGQQDQANHQYDLSQFYVALAHHELPAVSFLKAAKYQDGHAGYSDPLDEQAFVVHAINSLASSPEWGSTAVVIAYDDSDGFYDHAMPPIVNSSQAPADALNGPGKCGNGTPANGYQDRCGYGPRLPLLVVSPWAKRNYVDNTLTDQSSILRFVEDNWSLGRIGDGSFDAKAGTLLKMFSFRHHREDGQRRLLLDESTGEPLGPIYPIYPIAHGARKRHKH